MKNTFFAIAAVIFLLLDWTALHDIIRGNETNYAAEYTVIAISLIFYFGAGYYYIRKKKAITAK